MRVRHRCLMLIIILSFFDWKLRSSLLWIAIACSYVVGFAVNRVYTKSAGKGKNEVPRGETNA